LPQNIKHLTGINAETFNQVTNMIQEKHEELRRKELEKKKRKRAFGGGRRSKVPLPLRFLAVLMFLRLNIPQRAVAALLSGVSQSSLSRDLRELLPLLEQFLPVPQLWTPEQLEQDLEPGMHLTEEDLPGRDVIIDGMEQPVYRSQDYETQKTYYSGKKKKHTVKTQVVTDLQREIKAISSLFPGKVHDKKMAEKLHTTWRLPDETELLGDKAYQGLHKKVELMEFQLDEKNELFVELPRVKLLTPYKKPKGRELSEKKKVQNQAISSLRVRVEHAIGWVKNFKICSERFRCSHSIYTLILRVVCGFVNLQVINLKKNEGTAT